MPDWLSMKPAWRISRLEMRDPFGWHRIDEEALNGIREKLRWFESMTLREIFIIGKHLNHSVTRDKLCPDAQRRLADLRMDDIEELHTLHLTGTKRVWGILSENVISLLWWDPDHQVCPSLKKHT